MDLRRVILHDDTDRQLRIFWRLGNAIDGTPHHYGVTSPESAVAVLEHHVRRHGSIGDLQIWSHANARGVLIGGRHLNFADVRLATGSLRRSLWIRGCELAENRWRVQHLSQLLQCAIVAHTKRISAEPRWAPWIQGGLVVLRPGERPYWDPSTDRYVDGPKAGRRLPNVAAWRMTVPRKGTIDNEPI